MKRPSAKLHGAHRTALACKEKERKCFLNPQGLDEFAFYFTADPTTQLVPSSSPDSEKQNNAFIYLFFNQASAQLGHHLVSSFAHLWEAAWTKGCGMLRTSCLCARPGWILLPAATSCPVTPGNGNVCCLSWSFWHSRQLCSRSYGFWTYCRYGGLMSYIQKCWSYKALYPVIRSCIQLGNVSGHLALELLASNNPQSMSQSLEPQAQAQVHALWDVWAEGQCHPWSRLGLWDQCLARLMQEGESALGT